MGTIKKVMLSVLDYLRKASLYAGILFGYFSLLTIALYFLFTNSSDSKFLNMDAGILLGIWGILATIFLGAYQIKLAVDSSRLYLEQQNSVYQQINGIFSAYGRVYSKLQASFSSLSEQTPNTAAARADLTSAIGFIESMVSSSSVALNQIKYSIIKGKFKIHSAKYMKKDSHGEFKEITGLIISKVENLKYSFPVTPAELGGDPYPGIKKELEIDYEYNGNRIKVSFEDGFLASLP
jgi:hypothetical protein